MKRYLTILCAIVLFNFSLSAQRRVYNIPDIPGYVTLKCDFHMHTVFSDGIVWPTYRIFEAYRDGLDAIAITDHIEYLPKKGYIPVNHNAAWEIAESSAWEGNIILVHGAEITRSMPPGHLNALFVTDASELAADSVFAAVESAVKQGAFIQWNHPGWRSQEPDGIPKLYSIHRRLLKNGWIHGIEFFNSNEYYPHILEWCKEYGLAVMGNSDVHEIISESYREPDYHNRPMTLVFARERTSESLKEAMFADRTLVWFRDMIAGKEEYAREFFNQSISVGKPYYDNGKNLYLEIRNDSDVPFYPVNGPKGAPGSVSIAANSITRLILGKSFKSPLTYDVRNILTGTDQNLKIELKY